MLANNKVLFSSREELCKYKSNLRLQAVLEAAKHSGEFLR